MKGKKDLRIAFPIPFHSLSAFILAYFSLSLNFKDFCLFRNFFSKAIAIFAVLF